MFDKIRCYIKDNEFRLTIFNDRIHVVNYLEILSLNEERISFQTPENRIVIKGRELTVNKLVEKEVLIIGKVFSVEVMYD